MPNTEDDVDDGRDEALVGFGRSRGAEGSAPPVSSEAEAGSGENGPAPSLGVVLAIRDPLVSAGVKSLLEEGDGLRVVGEAG